MKKCGVVSESFKGTLSSAEICRIAKKIVAEVFPDCETVTVPVADGGEGTVDCFVRFLGAAPVSVRVRGPFGEPVEATYAVMGQTAVIEMAAAAGLPLVSGNRDPAAASTFGVGEMILSAVDSGCRKILLGLGGSATNDCGCGCAAALGVSFLRADGSAFVPVGGSLSEIADINVSKALKRLENVAICAMCDVENPLYGENGAAFVYAPQKGADAGTVRFLDGQLRHIGALIAEKFGAGIPDAPGAGAAGGMGAGCMAFLKARLCSGAQAILDAVGIDGCLDGADLVITGEGRIDAQSAQGKLISSLTARARAAGVPVVALVGRVDDSASSLYARGVEAMFSINRALRPLEDMALRSADDYAAALRDILMLIKLAEEFRR